MRKSATMETLRSGTIMIRDGIALPESLHLESLAWMPGWRIVKNLFGYSLGQDLRQAGWGFSFVGDAQKCSSLGKSEEAKQRALRSLLARLKGNRFNALEITAVSNGSFLGVPFISVTGYSRHIYESPAMSHLHGIEPAKALRPA